LEQGSMYGFKNENHKKKKTAFNNNATALWWPSWWESTIAGHNLIKGPSNDYSIKIWF
jgi:hypothetical protein